MESELLPLAKEFKYLRVLFMSDGTVECEIDRCGGRSNAGTALGCCGEERSFQFTSRSVSQPSPVVVSLQ